MKLITRYYRFLRKIRKSRRNPPYPSEEAFRQGVGTITKLLGEFSKVSYSLPEGAQEAIVLVFHDYRGHILALFREIAKAKCDIFSCDFPGHGMSVRRSQDLGWIDSVDHVLAVARAMVYRIIRSKSRGHLPIIIVGVSLGALVALRLLETQPFLARRVRGVV
jgi:alpha-beta hydrolase superfamily lysophospholipase